MKGFIKTLLAHLFVFSAGASMTAAAIALTYLAGSGDLAPGKDLGFVVASILFFSPCVGVLGNALLGYCLIGNEFRDDEVKK